MQIKEKIKKLLLWSQKYIQADMFYIASSGFWASLNFTITSLFSLVLVFFFANFLPKETYGIYKYILSLSGALGFLTLSGINTAVTQAVARGHEGVFPYAIKIQLKWNMIFLTASSLIGIYYLINGNNIIGLSVLIIGLVFPFIATFNTYGPFLSGKKEFKRLAIWGIFTNGIYSLSMILAIIFGKSVIALVAVYALTNLISTTYIYRKTLKIFKPSGENNEEEKKFFKYGLHLSFVNIFSTLSQYIDKIVIFHFLGAVELAIYGLALAIPERIRGYTKALSSIILSKLSEKTIKDIEPVFYKRTFQTMALGALISLGYILIAPLVFKIFFPKYLDSIFYSQLAALSFIFVVPGSYMGSVFRSQKMIKTIYLSSTAAHLSRIVLFIIFGALWGVLGVILASLLVYLIGFFYNFLLWEIETKKYSETSNGDINQDTLTE